MAKKISILIVDDERSVRDSLCSWFIEDGYRVVSAEDAKKALSLIESETFDIVLADIKMPGMDGLEMLKRIKTIRKEVIVIMMTAFAMVDTAVQALKDGAFDYVTKPFDPDDLSHLIRNASRQISLMEENEVLKDKVVSLENVEDLIGESKAMQQVLLEIESVAQSTASVIITGESGTGKELVARAIHVNSPRKFFPLVSVHCGALSESLLESELFGHEKGAFTGAVYNRKGRFEMADNGTIFLDEIATISTKMQVELLRVLETKSFVRVGGNKETKSDFRVICATNRDLKTMVDNGAFREDLFLQAQCGQYSCSAVARANGRHSFVDRVFHQKVLHYHEPAGHVYRAGSIVAVSRVSVSWQYSRTGEYDRKGNCGWERQKDLLERFANRKKQIDAVL
ncbi:sigma-54 dependent transcriptional regulator [uncultured Sunxiuqinia sp.]|uniref:sigma-54-dependent transcriptional regulator n=1 Tax=uncultured Sunxiuqinia sp. TaxID=1573825 RepID=UPI002AA6AE04|nr:sigma-54 dependent transcriptional regulator [uncultured Sunxiuqinia sp.]